MAGRAADIRSSAATPLEMARLALSVLGRDIGLGLGANIIHIDVRGEAANWVYAGAALSEAEFDAWVRSTAAELGRSTVEDATATLNDEVFADIGISEGESAALASAIETLRRQAGDF